MALQKKQTYQGPPQGSAPAKKQTSPQQAEQEDYSQSTVDPSAADAAIAEAKDFSAPDSGIYESLVYSMKLMPLGEKGQSVRVEYLLCSFEDASGEVEGLRYSRLHKILEADGRTPSKALPFYNAIMAKLGYPKEDRGERARQEITETKPAVSLKIKESNDPQYPPDAVIVSRLSDDNDNIQQLREWLENNPF